MTGTGTTIPSLYPHLGLTTIDSTALRFDPTDNSLVCFVMTDREGVKIAWDICGGCYTRITICRCKGGPSEPPYIYKMRTGEAMPADRVRVNIGRSPSDGVTELSAESKRRVAKRVADIEKGSTSLPDGPRPAAVVLTAPCARHTAESRLNSDGTYSCTVDGCGGVA